MKTTFEQAKRNYETTLATGSDTTDALTTLATAVAYSVINKCLDPQRKTAPNHVNVSNNGYSAVMQAVKTGIANDLRTLDNTRRNADLATVAHYDTNGDMQTDTNDRDAETALAALIGETLTDGIDLVQSAALAILEQTAEHAENGVEWLDRPYTVRRLSKRVYIQLDDSAAYKDVETTPIQEIYREVRRAVQTSRAVQTDPRNGYLYIEDITADGLDTIYYRMGKYVDLGGDDCNGAYTGDIQTALDYHEVVDMLKLTPNQQTVLKQRMQGKGYKAIATYMGIPQSSVCRCIYQVRAKAEKIGFTPEMWAEMTGDID